MKMRNTLVQKQGVKIGKLPLKMSEGIADLSEHLG